MAPLARVVAVGEPHHLTQRGNNRQPTFFDHHDRRTYVRLLASYCAREGIRLLGYCLMTNHIHLVAVPEQAASFARAASDAPTTTTPARCTTAGAATDTCGRTVSSRVRWTAITSGRRCATSTGTRSAPGWSTTRRRTNDRARERMWRVATS